MHKASLREVIEAIFRKRIAYYRICGRTYREKEREGGGGEYRQRRGMRERGDRVAESF